MPPLVLDEYSQLDFLMKSASLHVSILWDFAQAVLKSIFAMTSAPLHAHDCCESTDILINAMQPITSFFAIRFMHDGSA